MDQEELAPLFDRLLLLQRKGLEDTAATRDLIDILKQTDLQLISKGVRKSAENHPERRTNSLESVSAA